MLPRPRSNGVNDHVVLNTLYCSRLFLIESKQKLMSAQECATEFKTISKNVQNSLATVLTKFRVKANGFAFCFRIMTFFYALRAFI